MAKDEKGNTYISEAQSKAAAFWADRQKAKQERLEARQEARAARTDEEQLARLDKLLGPDMGAKRERARLHKRIEKKKAAAAKKAAKKETGENTPAEEQKNDKE